MSSSFNRAGLNNSLIGKSITSRTKINSQPDRICQLSFKINDIQVIHNKNSFELSRASKMDQLEAIIREIDEKLILGQETFNKRFQEIKDQIQKIQKLYEEDKQFKERYNEIKEVEFKSIELKINERIETEIHARKELEQRLIFLIEDKANMIRNDITKEAGHRVENIDFLKSCMENDITKLQESLKTENIEKEEFNSNLNTKINDEIQKLNQTITSQKKTREETEESMLEIVKEMSNKLKI